MFTAVLCIALSICIGESSNSLYNWRRRIQFIDWQRTTTPASPDKVIQVGLGSMARILLDIQYGIPNEAKEYALFVLKGHTQKWW